LENYFTKEEIDAAVEEFSSDHSLGLKGFNGFIKKCWSIIADDFYKLCQQFCEERVDPECINNCFIALILRRIIHLL
jgi:hypothetical protein